MGIKTRCRNCATKIDYGNTYCSKCKSIMRNSKTVKTKKADKFTNTSRWRSLKSDIKLRDKGICRLCFIKGRIEYKALQVHHIHKRSEVPALAYEPDNLVTLCRTCHNEIESLPASKQFEMVKMDYIEPKEEGLEFYL